MGLLDFLGTPLKALTGVVGEVIHAVKGDDPKTLEAKSKLEQIAADLEKGLADADQQFAQAQASVITAEINADSFLTRNWRPIMMLSFVVILLWNWIAVPIFAMQFMPVPAELWSVVKIGMGGYVFGRSAEKIAPHLSDAVKHLKNDTK